MFDPKFVLLVLFVGSAFAAEFFRDLAKRIKVGTTLDTMFLKDPIMVQMTAQWFNMITPDNEMKWSITEPENGKFNYGPADILVAYAEKHNMSVRGHNLIWHNQLPTWLDKLNKTELHTVMIRRIKDIVSRYKGRLYAWDVVNEVVEGPELRPTIWYKNFGDTYISEAFHLARKADPKVKLYINDYGIESNSSRTKALYNLVKKLKKQGVPIDGVGFQCHFKTGGVPKTLERVMKWFTGLGVEVAITEADVNLIVNNVTLSEQQQAKDYASIFRACQNIKQCVSTSTWTFTDKYAYHKSYHPCMWDENFRARPAVAAIQKVLKEG